MGSLLGSWWQYTRKHLAAIIIAFAVVVIVLIFVGYWFDWTGFNGYNKVSISHTIAGTSSGTVIRTEEYQPGKTLWDWLQLLIIPVVLAASALLFNFAITRTEQKIAAQRYKQDQQIALDKQREDLLQAYLDRMSELLLEKNLGTSQPDSEVRNVARVRTVSILFQLDVRRIKYVFAFLRESGLMSIQSPHSIVSLRQADLRNIDLNESDLRESDLREANLQEANLTKADLLGTRLDKANLKEANLSEARLDYVNFQQASLEKANFSRASLQYSQLNEANLKEANLSEADLAGADFGGANLSKANLSKTFAIYTGVVSFGNANLSEADFSGADFDMAFLNGARLYKANFRDAKLTTVQFKETDLREADFRRADLSQSNIQDALSLESTDLREVKGLTKEQLETCKAKGAIINETLATDLPQTPISPTPQLQSTDVQDQSAPSLQKDLLTPDTNSSAASTQQSDDVRAQSTSPVQRSIPPSGTGENNDTSSD